MAVKAQVPFTLLASAARTLATTSADQRNRFARGVRVMIDVTADPANASITPTIQGKTGQGDYYTLLAGAAITGTGNVELVVHPSLTADPNLVAKAPLGAVWRLSMAVADADSMTYSVTAEYLD
jgi:hypothetical protein